LYKAEFALLIFVVLLAFGGSRVAGVWYRQKVTGF